MGSNDAAQWFGAARTAHLRVVTAEQNCAHCFGFAHHLDVETAAHQELTLSVVAVFEATKGLYEVTRHDAAVEVDVFFECALRACSRGSGLPTGSPVAAADCVAVSEAARRSPAAPGALPLRTFRETHVTEENQLSTQYPGR